MGLFGSGKHDGPWPVEALTADLRITGEVAQDARSMAYTYFMRDGVAPPGTFAIDVARIDPTGPVPAPTSQRGTAHLTDDGGLIALLPRGGRADEVWEEQLRGGDPLPATLVAGPYEVTGQLVFPGGDVSALGNGRAVHLRDARFTRADGTGAAISAPRATVFLRHVQALLV